MHDARNSEATAVALTPRRAGRVTVAALLTALLVVATAWTAPADAAPSQTTPSTRSDQKAASDLQHEFEDVTAAELALFNSYTETTARVAELTAQLQALSASLVEAQAKVVAAEAQVARSEQKVRDLDGRLRETEAQLKLEEERLRNKAVSAYIRGGEGPATGAVNAVVKADDANDVGRSKVYGNAVVEDQRTIIRRVTDLKDEVTRLVEAAKVALSDANTQRATLEQERASVQSQRDQIATLQSESTVKAGQQEQLLQTVAAKKTEIAQRLAEAQARSNSISALLAERQKGQILPIMVGALFQAPLANPRLSSPFGMRRDPVTGDSVRLHAGLDFTAPTGTPILAPADGTVVSAGEMGGYGNCTIIDHGNGLSTLYGHQSELKVKPGQVMKRGDVIGLVGSTGHSTGPHLHWEVRALGNPQDPMPYLGLKPIADDT